MRARYDAELPPIISIVRCPGRQSYQSPKNVEICLDVLRHGPLALAPLAGRADLILGALGHWWNSET